MGKAFLYGSKKNNTSPNAELTVKCPANTMVRVQAKNTPTVMEKISDDGCSAVFTGLNEDEYTVSLPGVDFPPTEVIVIDGLKEEFEVLDAITIIYPVGGVCTCVRGNYSYTAPNTDGKWVIILPEVGEWTVSCDIDGFVTTKIVNVEYGAANATLDFTQINSRINVTYPRGSTCTCAQGSTILHAPDRSGFCTFDLIDAGDWTVYATNNVEYDTKIVSVERYNKSYDIELIHDLWIIDSTEQRQVLLDLKNQDIWHKEGYNTTCEGNSVTVYSGANYAKIISDENGSIMVEYDSEYIWSLILSPIIDLTNYSIIEYTASIISGDSRDLSIGFYSETGDSLVHGWITRESAVKYLDISGINVCGNLRGSVLNTSGSYTISNLVLRCSKNLS